MMKSLRARALFAATAGVLAFSSMSMGQVVINEVVYDDGGTDDREFVELYNAGNAPVAIGGWTLGGQDQVGANSTVTVTAGATLNPGQYYVIGYASVANVNQTVTGASGFWENDAESLELKDTGGTLMDALVYEKNKGETAASNAGHGVLPAGVVTQIGGGYWGNTQSSDVAGGPPSQSTGSLARWVDGRDSNSNGRDFGFRVPTPGTANNSSNMTAYNVPIVSGGTVGSAIPGHAFSFVNARIIDPTVVDGGAINPNIIAPAPGSDRAIIAWDSSGGGNGIASQATFNTTAASFRLLAYLDTRDLPLMSNASAVTFRGSEFTSYGIGSADALLNGVNLSGLTGFTGVRDNGLTGIHWIYEKVGETTTGAGDVSEKLYLVDANDGGDANAGDWTILATVDISGLASGWFDLGISIDASGNGVASFNGTNYPFTTSTALNGASFSVGYRENTQIGSDGTPDAILRPATYVAIPEPATAGLLALGAGLLGLRRRR